MIAFCRKYLACFLTCIFRPSFESQLNNYYHLILLLLKAEIYINRFICVVLCDEFKQQNNVITYQWGKTDLLCDRPHIVPCSKSMHLLWKRNQSCSVKTLKTLTVVKRNSFIPHTYLAEWNVACCYFGAWHLTISLLFDGFLCVLTASRGLKSPLFKSCQVRDRQGPFNAAFQKWTRPKTLKIWNMTLIQIEIPRHRA